jgi:hemolysin activation/secretion protein
MMGYLSGKGLWRSSFMVLLLIFGGMAPVLAATVPDNTGSVLNSLKQPEPQPGPGAGTVDPLQVTEPAPSAAADSERKIRVNAFQISGSSPVPEGELVALLRDQTGRELSLNDLNNCAARLTEYLRQKGFIVALAYLPVQQVRDGNVEITVVPGKYSGVKVMNRSRVNTPRLEQMLAEFLPDTTITKQSLERVLLIMNDLGGVSAKAVLKPGATTGTSELNVEVDDRGRFGGAANGDNWGNQYSGRTRGGLQFDLNNLAHVGDTIDLGYVTAGVNLKNFNCNYNFPFGYKGFQMGLKYSKVDYTLKSEFSSLGAAGGSEQYGVTWQYPLVRTRRFNLYSNAGWTHSTLEDQYTKLIKAQYPKESRKWSVGLTGNRLATTAVDSFALQASSGELNINNANIIHDRKTAQTNGRFQKLEGSVGRSQSLNSLWTLNLSGNFLWADSNLDSSEKFYLGGADGLRAYPQGEAGGDRGYRLTAELQRRLAGWSTPRNAFALSLFTDGGSVMLNKDPWDSSKNCRKLWDAGVGLTWRRQSGFSLRCDYARKLNAESDAATSADSSGRVWVRAVHSF